MSNYDHLVLGEGNPLHPANVELEPIFATHDLKECLTYFQLSGEPESLEMAIEFHTDKIEKTLLEITNLMRLARHFDNSLMANRLTVIRDELKRL